jgi:hypothetical protein
MLNLREIKVYIKEIKSGKIDETYTKKNIINNK